MFIPLFKQAVMKNGTSTFTRLALCDGHMWAMVLLFMFFSVLFQIKKWRGYASFMGFLSAIADGAGIYMFWDQYNFAKTAYSNGETIMSRFSALSGVTKVTITQTSGIYFVIAAAVLLAVICIVNLAVKD